MSNKPNYVGGIFWIIASITFSVFWFTHIQPQKTNRNSLIKILGTLKTVPTKYKGTKGSIGAQFELNEYKNTVFGISSGLYAFIDRKLFKDAKINDTVFFLIDKELYYNRLTQPYTNNFINNFPDGERIAFYDLTLKGKNYLPLDNFEKKQVKENTLKNVLYAVFLIFMLRQVYVLFKKNASSQP